MNTVVLPGDVIYELEATSNDKEAFRFGPGIREESGKIMSLKAGVLRTKEPNILWIDSNQRRVGIVSACSCCQMSNKQFS